LLTGKKLYSQEEKDSLWEKYRSGDESVFTDLCEAYVPLVESIAYGNKLSLPPSVEIGDLISEGFLGLADAVIRFSPGMGAKFDTYAASRIRGAILDGLRDADPISRHFRGKFKTLSAVTDSLSEFLCRQPTDWELADELGWPLDEVRRIKGFYANSFTVCIDDFTASSEHETFTLAEVMPDHSLVSPGFALEEAEIMERLIEGMNSLTELESIVLFWRHEQNLSYGEIGERLGVKVPRVSRIYASAMSRLRAFF